jgi:hypothetical protein
MPVVDALLDALLVPAETPPQVAPAPAPAPVPLVDKRELARLLDVSVATIDRLARSGMPFQPVGDARRFDIAACRAWLADHGKHAAVPPALLAESASHGRDGGVKLLSRARGRR